VAALGERAADERRARGDQCNAQGRGLWPVLVTDVPPLLGGLTGVIGIVVLGAAGAALLARTPGTVGTARAGAVREA
jgi:hypothetical protein